MFKHCLSVLAVSIHKQNFTLLAVFSRMLDSNILTMFQLYCQKHFILLGLHVKYLDEERFADKIWMLPINIDCHIKLFRNRFTASSWNIKAVSLGTISEGQFFPSMIQSPTISLSYRHNRRLRRNWRDF